MVVNALRTPDGTLLISRHRHDYVTHEDVNGNQYMIDGGLDYIRSSANGDEVYETVYMEDGHDVVREHLTWGTYGKDGDQPLEYVLIKDMEDGHLQACLDNVEGMYPVIRESMENELHFRENIGFGLHFI